MSTLESKRRAFRAMHEEGCFKIANAANPGEARRLEKIGFKALATTSVGLATQLGRDDLTVGVEETIDNIRQICAATNLPVNVDFESGFSNSPEGVAENVTTAAAAGLAGISIEDRDGAALFNVSQASERIAAAREALNRIDPNLVLVGRTEGFLLGETDVNETIARLKAYADAGADVLYAPAVTSREDIRVIVSSCAPKPVNVLLLSSEMKAKQLAEDGVRRVSVGGFLTTRAWDAFQQSAEQFYNDGQLSSECFKF